MSYLLCTNRSLPCEGTGLELSEFPISREKWKWSWMKEKVRGDYGKQGLGSGGTRGKWRGKMWQTPLAG